MDNLDTKLDNIHRSVMYGFSVINGVLCGLGILGAVLFMSSSIDYEGIRITAVTLAMVSVVLSWFVADSVYNGEPYRVLRLVCIGTMSASIITTFLGVFL